MTSCYRVRNGPRATEANVPTGWLESQWYGISDAATDDDLPLEVEFVCVNARELRDQSEGDDLLRWRLDRSPVVAVVEPLHAPSGWAEPWVVIGPGRCYVSFRLPVWLWVAPDAMVVPLETIRFKRVSEIRQNRSLTREQSATASLAITPIRRWLEVEGASLNFNVHTYSDSKSIPETNFVLMQGRQLATQLEALARDSGGHLISGFHDSSGFPVWF